VISFHGVVGVLLQDVPAARNQVIEHARVDRCPVGGDLRRRWSAGQRPGEERSSGRAIAAFGQQNVDDLAVLIDRPFGLQAGVALRTGVSGVSCDGRDLGT
jgi:hypothetical protein